MPVLDALELLELPVLPVVDAALELDDVCSEPVLLAPELAAALLEAAELPLAVGLTPTFGQRFGSWLSATQMNCRQVWPPEHSMSWVHCWQVKAWSVLPLQAAAPSASAAITAVRANLLRPVAGAPSIHPF